MSGQICLLGRLKNPLYQECNTERYNIVQLSPFPGCCKTNSLTFIAVKDSHFSGLRLWSWHILVFRSVLKMLIICFMLSGVWLKWSGVGPLLPYKAAGCVRACLSSDMFYSQELLQIHKIAEALNLLDITNNPPGDFRRQIDHVKK